MDDEYDEAEDARATPPESVEVWGRDVTREEFLEGRYGASTESEADEARAGGSLVTPMQVEDEHVGGEIVDDGERPASESASYDQQRDALSHGISRTATHIAGTDVGRTPTDPSGAYETGDNVPAA
jgi:hypothetical protein